MKRLTRKEKRTMKCFWQKESMSINELCDVHPEPKLHFNELASQINTLQEKGYIGYNDKTKTFYATVSKNDYCVMNIESLVKKCFHNSYMTTLPDLIRRKKLYMNDLLLLKKEIELGGN
ncbi:MAG: BlaI/MecI/CopY family transcriptional regulator [Salinivirgaceae bacterium]|nr:BlaI/MecI/CopY family transcriptional regulator [Salinivirgaceae bacterium]